jgi:beta-phosphoglucomutase-like phosphatase (HAD superfamily)
LLAIHIVYNVPLQPSMTAPLMSLPSQSVRGTAMIRLAVFDMAGTTVHDDDAVNACLGEALKNGGRWLKREVINEVMGVPKLHAIDMLLEPLPPDAADDAVAARKARVGSIYRDFADRMIKHYEKSPAVREVDGASDVFTSLKWSKVRVALDTGFDRRIANAVLRRTRWIALGLVDATVTSDEVVRGRPGPDMIFAP